MSVLLFLLGFDNMLESCSRRKAQDRRFCALRLEHFSTNSSSSYPPDNKTLILHLLEKANFHWNKRHRENIQFSSMNRIKLCFCSQWLETSFSACRFPRIRTYHLRATDAQTWLLGCAGRSEHLLDACFKTTGIVYISRENIHQMARMAHKGNFWHVILYKRLYCICY